MARATKPTPAETIGADGFVTLEFEAFRKAFAVFLGVLSGEVRAPAPPKSYLDANTGQATPLEDTTFNRAWIAAGRLFDDEVERLSFYGRLELFGAIARERKYEKYIGFGRASAHVAFVAAFARFRFSERTTRKARLAAFDEEQRRQLANRVRH
jgi:hypothetical protein